MNSLLVSGLIILFIESESLFSVGFQMSYTIVLELFGFLKAIQPRVLIKVYFLTV